ncbi:MAG: hypothetical protein KIH09_17375 [Candidatus Freyarchaeota archaeon]|nr:hypothetical protein [Candidatus Jordarchaeia archaeon]
MKKVFAIVIPVLLVLSVFGASPVMAGIQSSPNSTDSTIAKKLLDIADDAKLRVEALLGNIKGNSTLMSNQTINNTIVGLLDNSTGAFTNGTNILQDAHTNFLQGNYTETIRLSLEAMRVFREIYAELIQLIGDTGENIQAQGLLVAMNCALERLHKMNESLSNLSGNIQAARTNLSEAEKLLNLTEATLLLQKGDVSTVAHMIAEANKLMNQAMQTLKFTAQERIQARVDQYLQKLDRNRERLMERLNATGINATELFTEFGFQNMGEFNQAMNSLKQMVKNHMAYGQWKKAIDSLNSIANFMQSFEYKLQRRAILFPAPILPSPSQGEPELKVSVEKLSIGSTLTLIVTINNTGNATIVFPNSAYGVTIEKSSNGDWIAYYTPISAQVLITLKPGETGVVNIILSAPQSQGFQGLGKTKGDIIRPTSLPSGNYRVTVHGWIQGTYVPVTVSVDFTMP